ncbi:MAG: hypothetical protein QOE54_677 [Streptosporangiaceae bacterium]|nr:hypothetical protein [Streptosporangiaceae bacterium]
MERHKATVDAYDEYEQLSGFHVMISDNLAVPFQTTVLGVEVTVKKIDLVPGSGIVAICAHGRYRQSHLHSLVLGQWTNWISG